jgi:flagellar basal body P-ring protein FlgI
MRPKLPRRSWAFVAVVATAVLALFQVGAGPGKKKGKEPPPPTVQETVGDLSFVVSRGEWKVEGVGLVRGLDNTGADPPASWYRKQLVDEMSKAGVEHAEKLLSKPQWSMVIVRLTIPIGVNTTDRLDVQVEVPPACGTTSLAGGYLMLTRLREVNRGAGASGPLAGKDMALAQGPIMIGTPAKPNDPKVGRVLGGGKVKKDYPFTLVIKENRESYRTAKMLETVVNERFHQTEDGHQKGATTAKTPSFLELKVPTLYHQNQQRFFRVVQLLQMIDSPDLRARRMTAWSNDLRDPATAGVAAMKLEGLGTTAVDSLKEGLKSPNAQVRYFSAESLAYLNDTSGVTVLGETVVAQPKFRAYALAALAALDQPAAHLKLRKLMDEPSVEVRYGAFNALRTLDASDPFLGLVRVLDTPKDEEEVEERPQSMALAIATASRRKREVQDDPFGLYVVDSEGPPLVHLSRTRRCEIVVFGRTQKLMTPVVLGTGSISLNAADNDEKIEISKIVPSPYGDSDTKITSALELPEVVRRLANMGAGYPEVVSILETAERQKNLPGQLVVDAVPTANNMYLEAVLGKDITGKRDDAVKRTSAESSRSPRRRFFGLFSGGEPALPAKDRSAKSADATAGTEPPLEIPPLPSDMTSPADTGATTDAKPPTGSTGTKGDASKTAPARKGADADDKTGDDDDETPAPRRRLSDLFRRGDDS